MELENIAKQIEKTTGFECYAHCVRKVLSSVLAESDLWKIFDYSDIPLSMASQILKALQEQKLIAFTDSKIKLSSKGMKLIDSLQIEKAKHYICPTCNGKKYPINSSFEALYQKFIQVVQDRPEPIQQYDQGYVTAETSIARLIIADERNNLKDKKIVLLGDDDLMSIAIGLSGLAKEVIVFEADERLIDYINKKCTTLGISNIKAIQFNLKSSIPDEYVGYFDTFLADPPETLAAFKAFIGRGIALLKEAGSAGYFGFTLRDASLRKWQQIQKVLLNEFEVAITDIIYNFNEYVNWDYHDNTPAFEIAPVKTIPEEIWYKSSLYRIETLPGFKGMNEPISMEVLHADEENTTS